jgi:hypothetical protein
LPSSDLHRDQRVEDVRDRHVQRGRGADHRPRPRQEVHAASHRRDTREDAAVHAEPVVQRQHGRDGDQERHRAGAIKVDQQRQQGRAHHDARRPAAHGAQDAVDDRVQHAGIGDDAEVEDGEDEHPRYRRHVLDAGQDELAGIEPEAARERGDDGNGDERDQRRHALGQDDDKQRDDGQQPEQCEHGLLRVMDRNPCWRDLRGL